MKNKIEEFCSALANFYVGVYKGAGQPPIWPIPIDENLWYLSKYFIPELHKTLKKLRLEKIEDERIAELLKSSFIVSHFLELAETMKITELKKEERIDLLEALINYLKYFRKEDIFCRAGRNVIWKDEEAASILARLKMIDDISFKKYLTELEGRLWLLSEGLHGIFHCCGYEIHGPYFTSKNEFLLVKDYFYLNIPEVWPFTAKLGFQRITCFDVYKDVDLKIDFLGHPISTTSLPQHLQRAQIFVDSYPLINFNKVISNCDLVLTEAAVQHTTLTKKEWEKKFVELHFYYLKPLKDFLGEDWRPSREIYEAIEQEEPDEDYLKAMEELARVREMPDDEAFNTLKEFYISSIYEEEK